MFTYVTNLDISATAACLHKPVFRQTAVISWNGWIGPQKGKKTIAFSYHEVSQLFIP